MIPAVYFECVKVLLIVSPDRQRARQRALHEPSHDQIVALITRLGTASRYAGLDAAAVAVGGGAAARRVTLAELHELEARLPLRDAAASLGVSPADLRAACRQVLVVDAASVDRQRARQRALHKPSHNQVISLITANGTLFPSIYPQIAVHLLQPAIRCRESPASRTLTFE